MYWSVTAANCSVQVLAHSGHDGSPPMYGHVKLNGNVVWESAWANASIPNRRGVNVMLVAPFTCTLLEPPRQFDTYISEDTALQLSTFLQELIHGIIVVGVTAQEPTRNLQNARGTLRSMGAGVCDVQLGGAFAFVAQKDFPHKTVLEKSRTAHLAQFLQPEFYATITGTNELLCFIA